MECLKPTALALDLGPLQTVKPQTYVFSNGMRKGDYSRLLRWLYRLIKAAEYV